MLIPGLVAPWDLPGFAERMPALCPSRWGLMEIPGQVSNPWPRTVSAKHTKVFGLISRCSPVGYLIYSMPVNIHFTPKQGQVHHFCNHHLFMSGGLQEAEINGFP